MSLGLGVVGAWYAMVTDIVVRAILLAWRFFHGGWQRIEV
jgi:MATE family, multidrug efflux pump